jgi:methylthioribose-1-phosphate isomerase
MRTIFWDYENQQIKMIDQRKLPVSMEIHICQTIDETVTAIREMVIRGAPAIGICAAFGLALAAQRSKSQQVSGLVADLEIASFKLQKARPTAVNLTWGITRILDEARNFTGNADELKGLILSKAQQLADEDVMINLKLASFGADLIEDGDTIIHHCNTGALAAVDWGTAIGAIRMAHERGLHLHVLVDETRPRLQGSRLTAWELDRYGISYEIITDNMSGYFLRSGIVNKVLFGADRVAANGDVINKIGTYMLALAANENNVPVFSFVPTSSIDISVENGDQVPIEERPQEEVLNISVFNIKATPEGAHARNPAFDVTPNELINAIVTEKGVLHQPYALTIAEIFN